VSAATIEFILDWLEGLDNADQGVLFGNLGANLVLQKRHMTAPLVATGLRPFPVTSATPREQRYMAKWIPFEDYSRRVAPRLFALEQAESAPKVMSAVIVAWGLGERDLSGLPGLDHL
jgi:hypothetical protein